MCIRDRCIYVWNSLMDGQFVERFLKCQVYCQHIPYKKRNHGVHRIFVTPKSLECVKWTHKAEAMDLTHTICQQLFWNKNPWKYAWGSTMYIVQVHMLLRLSHIYKKLKRFCSIELFMVSRCFETGGATFLQKCGGVQPLQGATWRRGGHKGEELYSKI